MWARFFSFAKGAEGRRTVLCVCCLMLMLALFRCLILAFFPMLSRTKGARAKGAKTRTTLVPRMMAVGAHSDADMCYIAARLCLAITKLMPRLFCFRTHVQNVRQNKRGLDTGETEGGGSMAELQKAGGDGHGAERWAWGRGRGGAEPREATPGPRAGGREHGTVQGANGFGKGAHWGLCFLSFTGVVL